MEERKGKHLTWNDRLTIERMLLKNYSKKDIANAVGCCIATIYNEIKRATYIHTNSDLTEEGRYNPDGAQEKYRAMLKDKGIKPKLQSDKRLLTYIEYMILEMRYSPAAVVMFMKTSDDLGFDTYVCVNTIYSGIRKGYFEKLTFKDLPQRGRRGKSKKKDKREQKRAAKGTSIEKRPEEVLERILFGYWEMDCVIGRSNNRRTILVMTERKTRYEILEVLKEHTAAEVVRALNRIERRYGSMFFKIFRSITVDNGSEFSDFEGMEKALYRKGKRTKIYYCHPRTPSERGSNEVGNKLIRRFYPKSTDFDKHLNKKDLKDVEFWINTYPRAIFNGKSAMDKFSDELKKIGYDDTG